MFQARPQSVSHLHPVQPPYRCGLTIPQVAHVTSGCPQSWQAS
ncbi:hypothetical protein [Streptomyces sp. Root1310]|nr:hypothetical protein [Streptomyces sp. Root1310]